MKVRSIFGFVLVVFGMGIVASGVSMQLQALDCQATASQTGMKCDRSKPIHQLDNPTVDSSCEADGPDDCVAGAQSQCESLEGYEVAKNGECVVDIYYPY
ncbi:hypothetical protein KOR42_32760 [Thalassoglobus neptunius]|uniref:Uncharacterized protein n=1 Tax=Thalassoglobus neptunius TaxID=1938619 RepID=A0A5C5WPQ1_9PLAN|nr:hypothetical protein [Thalassoglobus neptunius]TWT51993.1 hypothetical protein KOR42_32760 [Thalassoglobus neptunius]